MSQLLDAGEAGAALGSVELWLVGIAILALLLALGWWLSFTAVRLDRLHTRNEATEAALDAQVVRRAEAAVGYAYGGDLNPASAELLLDAATRALEQQGEWTQERCDAESELTQMLAVVVDSPNPALTATAERVALARRFHNEAIGQTLTVRRRRVVRLLHLAGHTPMPAAVIFDD
ncbi:hypothetical protein K0651_09765 [Ornithinimicrobium sp. Arc0846-15]|nr:hypothetical protein [Ornithinimicrobium laminariae]